MKEFFNIPMQNIAITFAVLLLICLAVLVFLGLRNRILVKLALRNIPRRPAQTTLIIVGLMLSTTIIAASLAIGDTVAGTIRGAVLDGLGQTDLRVRSPLAAAGLEEGQGSIFGDTYIDAALQQQVLDTVAGDDRIDGVLPQIRETLPVLDERTQLTEARMNVAGLDPTRQDGFGPITSTSGEEITLASLGPNEALLNETAAEEIEAQAGDQLTVVTPTGRQSFTLRAVVRDGGLAANDRRLIMRLDTMQQVMDRAGQVNRIDISLRGDREGGLELSDEVSDELRVAFTDLEAAQGIFEALDTPEVIAAIEARIAQNPGNTINAALQQDLEDFVTELEENDTVTDEFRSLVVNDQLAVQVVAALEAAGLANLIIPITGLAAQVEVLSVDEVKQDGLSLAEFVGSIFVTFFTIFGSFSIIVGLLLIFLVFVMLAAARSNEMGIARAVGTKRRHLVQMFTFEGAAYAIGAAVVGTIIGLLAAGLLVRLLVSAIGGEAEEGNFTFQYSVTANSVIAGFSLGLLLTLATVGVAAYRVSKLNIVVAIRGLPAQFQPSDTPPIGKRLLYVGQALLGPFYYAYRFIAFARRGEDATRPGFYLC